MALRLFKRPFSYDGFIGECRDLIARSVDIRDLARFNLQPGFIPWHHAVADSLSRVQALGYKVNTRFFDRKFRSGDGSGVDAWNTYRLDLAATVGELEHLVDLYNRYGAPPLAGYASHIKTAPPVPSVAADSQVPIAQPSKPVQSPDGVVKPDNITLPWLWHHMSIRGWIAAIGVLAFVFGLGVSAAKYLHLG